MRLRNSKNNKPRVRFPGVFLVAMLGLALTGSAVNAADEEAGAEKLPDYTRTGADTCLKCHGDDAKVMTIFDTPHAVKADGRTPFAGAQCESCHGPGSEHAGRVGFGKERPPIPAFGAKSPWTTERENKVCLGCHQDQEHRFWDGSGHQRQDVGCVDCHTVHARHDPVMETETQAPVCLDCHSEQRIAINSAYSHPIRYGEMACTSCHEPHGSLNPAMLTGTSVNRTCYKCHAETRGPFLWEHEPVTEDCTLCHRPHGSNNPALLTRRPPLLCQQCHSRLSHPSIGRTAEGLPSGEASQFLLSGSCLNCHSQVHGSNHPSGTPLSR